MADCLIVDIFQNKTRYEENVERFTKQFQSFFRMSEEKFFLLLPFNCVQVFDVILLFGCIEDRS